MATTTATQAIPHQLLSGGFGKRTSKLWVGNWLQRTSKLEKPDKKAASKSQHLERLLGDSEASYFLPSRENGVNDMYLHIGFRAPVALIRRERVKTIWATLLLRHPLLASEIKMHTYEDIRFTYDAPPTAEKALQRASKVIVYSTKNKDDLIDDYLNGPRTLSNNKLSYLVVSQPKGVELKDGLAQFEVLFCAAHFLGDGSALHQLANDFFGLLGGPQSDEELRSCLVEEWKTRWGNPSDKKPSLPLNLEEKLPSVSKGKLREAASRVDFDNNQAQQIGGHSLPKRKGDRRTIVPTIPFDAERTKRIIKTCKAHGVTISSAMFAICNIAWARMTQENRHLPTMMYSALNIRPYLLPDPESSYWFLAVGYFNVILPSFLPRTCEDSKTFWYRAQKSRDQSVRAAKNSMVVDRCQHMAKERGDRARRWAKEDDEKAAGTWKPSPAPVPTTSSVSSPPSTALIGLSLLGNLDGTYKHSNFPSIELHTLTTGSRQRSGGMLMFVYTFAGRLWVSLGYDENGFEEVTVKKYWANILGAMDEFLA